MTRETLCLDDFKCDSYTLHPYYIYHHYPQKCIESIQKKTLKKFLQHTYLVRESYSSSKREILVVSSPPLSHSYTLRGDLYPNTTHTYLECRECFGAWESIEYLPKEVGEDWQIQLGCIAGFRKLVKTRLQEVH